MYELELKIKRKKFMNFCQKLRKYIYICISFTPTLAYTYYECMCNDKPHCFSKILIGVTS